MEWVEIIVDDILAHMPTDVKVRYEAWLGTNPDRSGRLAEITANTLREFRDNLKSVQANIVDPRETWVPRSAVRHIETIIVFSLAMEMGLPVDSAGQGARYAADIFLRQILMGRYRTTTPEAGEPSPLFSIPNHSEISGRALPLIAAALMLLAPFSARAGWIRPDSAPLDTDVVTTFNPSAYSIATSTLFGHLQGINAVMVTRDYVTNAIATITNTTDLTARTLATSAASAANLALTTLHNELKSDKVAAFGIDARAGHGGIAIGCSSYALEGGVAVGEGASAFTYNAVSLGHSASSTNAGIAIGTDARARGRGNVAIGGSIGAPFWTRVEEAFTNTWQLGAGTATRNGWLHFKNYPVIGPNGELEASSICLGGVTNTAWPSDWATYPASGTVTMCGNSMLGLGAVTVTNGFVYIENTGGVGGLGIGRTAGAVYSLDVSGTARITASIISAAFRDANNIAYQLRPSNPDTSLTLAGKAGIGTTSPEAMLHVVGDAHVTSNLVIGGSVTRGLQAEGSSVTNFQFWAGPASSQSHTNANTIYFTW